MATNGKIRTSRYLARERKIARAEHGGILERWEYGRALLAHKAGRKQLPNGMANTLVTEAQAAGLSLSQQEIQRRVRCAQTYATEAEVRHAVTHFGTWHDLVQAGFPAVEVPDGGPVLDLDLEAGDGADVDQYVQDQLGDDVFPPTLSIGRDRVPLRTATLRDLRAYLDAHSAITARFIEADARRRTRFAALSTAVGGRLDATYVEAVQALDVASGPRAA